MPSARTPLPLRHAPSAVPLLSALLLAGAAAAQESALFLDDEPLAVRLEAPLRTVFADRDDPDYQPARIEVANAQGEPLAVDLRVRVRGKSRTEACDFPPLLLNFPGDQPAGSPFAGENRLKLVTHCLASTQHEEHVLLEQQIYRALNLLTATSLRIRPVAITYFDTDGNRETANRIGFLIEDEERFAERAGLALVSTPRVDRTLYEPSVLALLDVFQYFIGNTDWSAVEGPGDDNCCHNLVPYARPDGVLLPVPYDFDAAGIVESPYAFPSTQLPIRSVRQRLYRGSCRELSELAPVFATFTAQREALTALFSPAAGVPERRAARAREYIDQFYAVLADEARAQREFRRNCGR
jgi:hypothetical protein